MVSPDPKLTDCRLRQHEPIPPGTQSQMKLSGVITVGGMFHIMEPIDCWYHSLRCMHICMVLVMAEEMIGYSKAKQYVPIFLLSIYYQKVFKITRNFVSCTTAAAILSCGSNA